MSTNPPLVNRLVGYKNMYHYEPLQIPLFKSGGTISEWFSRYQFRTGGWYKLGLYRDDILAEYPCVEEAIRRLPASLKQERDYRLARAFWMDVNQEYLPRDKWHTYEEDITKGRYLTPYVNEVLSEMKEMDEWEATH